MPPLLDGRTNACFGVRAFDGYTSHSFLFVLGNKGVTLACNVLFNVYLHDIMTCHKMIRTDLFRSLPLRSAGFAIEPEITARLVQRGERIFEVPVHYRARANEEGKKLTARRRLPRDRARCCAAGFTPAERSRSASAAGASPVEARAATIARRVSRRCRTCAGATGAEAGARRRLVRRAAGLGGQLLAAARALSAAVLPTVPSYDPWAWIVWGREVVRSPSELRHRRRPVVEAAAGAVHDASTGCSAAPRRRCG